MLVMVRLGALRRRLPGLRLLEKLWNRERGSLSLLVEGGVCLPLML